MNGSDRPRIGSQRPSRPWRALTAAALVVSSVAVLSPASASATPLPYRIDLKVLVLDDGSTWVGAIESQMQVEGVPFNSVDISTANIDDAFLTAGDYESRYQAVVVPDSSLSQLSSGERAALRAWEAKFGIRQVDAWDNDINTYSTIGLDTPTYDGVLDGATAQVTAAGKGAGFGYLDGPVPFSIGSFAHIAQPLGGAYTSLVNSAPPGGGTSGSILGVYSSGGVEQLVITAGFDFSFLQFKYLGHGIITWMTRGVHFGFNRNNFTFHVDDAFAEVAIWDSTRNCTPGEDCTANPSGLPLPVRMTPADVTAAITWMQTAGYQLTLAFNGFYAYEGGAPDALADALVANQDKFRWLNHGYEHLFQGCIQTPQFDPNWVCNTINGQIEWVPQTTIYNEIQQNIEKAVDLGLTFEPTEYLSGEHSGLKLPPKQVDDNPHFVAALVQAGILRIGSDASRESGSRVVGSATTIPRHPTALYYNTATFADAVDEYNWLYTSAADGGSGLCGTTVPPCITPLGVSGFTSYIVPTDAAFDLGFILSNDPRPFYAHTSNLTGDRLAYYLLDAILSTYRAAFTDATPLVNLTLTQAADELVRQQNWADPALNHVTGYVENGQITITNNDGIAVPFTAPAGSTINGTSLESYGGERSAWLPAGNRTGTVPSPVLTTTGNVFRVGHSSTMTLSATSVHTPVVSVSGAVPNGLVLTPAASGATVSGTPAPGTEGTYPLVVTMTDVGYPRVEQVDLIVARAAQFTSDASATAVAGNPFSFTVVTANGLPAPAISVTSGSLPSGINLTDLGNGTATLSGTSAISAAGQSFPITLTAVNAGGSVNQSFVLSVNPDATLRSIAPARLADTRPGFTTIDRLYAGDGMRATGSTLELQVAGRGTVPIDALAVALNVTVDAPVGPGFVTVFPCGSEQPNASNLNYTTNATVPNAVIAKLGKGKVCLFVSNATHLIVDVNGYFPATSTFSSMNPARLLETRSGPGLATIDGLQQGDGMRAQNTITTVDVTDRAGVPSTAAAVVLNVTVTEAQGPGFVTVYPCGEVPTASNINYTAGSTVANMVVAKVSPDGNVCLYNNEATHLVVDVNGYFPSDGSYSGMSPARLLETRPSLDTIDGEFENIGLLPNGTVTSLVVAGRGSVPANAKTVVLNVTVTESAVPGFITVYPCSPDIPLASNLNYDVGSTSAIAVIAQIPTTGPSAGKVCLFNSGATQLVADVNGYLVN